MNYLIFAALVLAALSISKPKWLQNVGQALNDFADTYNAQYTEDEDSVESHKKSS